MSNVIKFPDMFSAAAGKVSTVSGAEEAKQCIKCALHTVRGELFGDGVFGSTIKSFLFEHISASTKDDIAEEIIRVANVYAKDIVVQQVGFDFGDPLTPSVKITIYYYVKSLGIEDSTTLDY